MAQEHDSLADKKLVVDKPQSNGAVVLDGADEADGQLVGCHLAQAALGALDNLLEDPVDDLVQRRRRAPREVKVDIGFAHARVGDGGDGHLPGVCVVDANVEPPRDGVVLERDA